MAINTTLQTLKKERRKEAAAIWREMADSLPRRREENRTDRRPEPTPEPVLFDDNGDLY